MNKPVKVLIVEDSEDDAKLALRALRGGGFEPTYRRVQTAVDMQAALAGEHWDAVISDFRMPGFTGMDALKILRAAGLDIPFILISGTIGEETAVEAMKAGASDYVMKKSLARLAPALERELKEAQMRAAHRRDQQALTDSQERYRLLFEASIDAVLLTAPDGRILAANPSACRMFGFTEEEIRQGGRTRIVDESDPRLAVAMEERSRTGRFMGELTFVRKSGTTFPGDISTAVFKDNEGQARTSMIIRDATERKDAEKVLLASEMRFRQMAEQLTTTLESITDAFFTLDREWRFTFLNREAERLLARTRAELTGRNMWTEFPDTIGSRFEREYRQAVADNETVDFEEFYPPLNTWFGVRAYPSEQGLAVYFRDITERKHAEQKFKDLLEATPDAMVIVNHDAEMVLINAQAVKLFGWRREELLGQKIDMLVPEGFRHKHPENQSRFFAQPRARAMGAGLDLFGLRKDGSAFPVEISLSPLETSEGTLAIAAIRDITERKTAERRIAYLIRVYAVLSDINALIVRVSNRDMLLKEACRIAVEKGGFHIALIAIGDRSTMTIASVAMAGMNGTFLSRLKDHYSLVEGMPLGNPVMTQAINEKRTVVINDLQSDAEVVFRQQYAEAGIHSVAILPLIVADEAVGAFALYATESEFFHEEELKLLTELADDIAYAIDHIGKQARLDYLAYYDELTGLANRTLFLERVTQYIRSAISGGHKLAVLLIDLERFKNINDSLGRPAGDALLRQVADWLKRDSGDANLVARLDADHFATVLPVVNEQGDEARLLEKTMHAFMDHPFRLNDAVFRIAAKAGVAIFPDDGADADTLFKKAEAALKRAKARGERYLFYTKTMTEAVEGKLTLENQLRQALDNEEFVLHYQPKVNLTSGKLTSAEALIRWNDPRTGLVPPGRFIPILEETGLIYDVGRWALRQAIKDYLRWRAAGLAAVRIAVNVSPLQLRNRGFIDEIGQVISIDAHAAEGLELEITESLIMEDVKHNIASLSAIRAMGITIAIDDFGTGFSSLSYLAKLPVDTLKIDRSFVIEMTAGPEGLALISTIINLAHSLRLKVVAEGVETEEQSRLLRLLSCDEMQGFLFSKAVPVEIFESRFLATATATATATGAAGA